MPLAAASLSLPSIETVRAEAFRIPTDAPESDGTLAWDATTLVVVEVRAADETGLGFTYADASVARCVADNLADLVEGRNAGDVPAIWSAMFARLRNLGREGLAAMAVSAVDFALWDLKARLLGLPLAVLLGRVRDEAPVYGSGGFTSYPEARLRGQFSGWAEDGIRAFKMKVGREPARDAARVAAARDEIGPDAALFVDANSAYTLAEARSWAGRFAAEWGVSWLEEPLPPDDLEDLRFLRERAPAGLEIAEGEYGAGPDYFRRLLEARAADVVMPDATRCGGITGFLKIATLCEAWHAPLSTHCAPSLHVHLGCAVEHVRHLEYFHDHARIEGMLFDGAPRPRRGALAVDEGRPGLGLEFKRPDARPYAV